jgi:hypothetical protein
VSHLRFERPRPVLKVEEESELIIGVFIEAIRKGDWRGGEALMLRVFDKPAEQLGSPIRRACRKWSACPSQRSGTCARWFRATSSPRSAVPAKQKVARLARTPASVLSTGQQRVSGRLGTRRPLVTH